MPKRIQRPSRALATPRLREVKNEAEIFYKAERQRWSERLRNALDTLIPEETLVNKASAVAERMHMSADVEPVAR